MTNEQLDEIAKIFNTLNHVFIDDDLYTVGHLMYHVVIYKNPTSAGGYENRYCVGSFRIAEKALHELETTGKMKYWQKHHNKNIRSVNGQYYHSGDHSIPENSLGECEWNSDKMIADEPYELNIIDIQAVNEWVSQKKPTAKDRNEFYSRMINDINETQNIVA